MSGFLVKTSQIVDSTLWEFYFGGAKANILNLHFSLLITYLSRYIQELGM